MFNGFIGLIISYSLGLHHGYLEQLNKAILRLDPSKQNRSTILAYIQFNCSQLIVKYPEFDIYPQIDLCNGYDLPMKLVKISIILSTLYIIFLFYLLYDSAILSAMIMGISLSLLFNSNFSNDRQILYLVNITLILIGFVIIISHCILAHPNNQSALQRNRAA
jgi:hypothetical protein